MAGIDMEHLRTWIGAVDDAFTGPAHCSVSGAKTASKRSTYPTTRNQVDQ
jgi:hypothetical protein